jgi:small subunit ribosomal protein S13
VPVLASQCILKVNLLLLKYIELIARTMARISGVNLPNQKRLEIGLTYIFGIGRSLSNKIIRAAGLDPNMKCEKLEESQVNQLRKIIESDYKTEGELKREILSNIKRLKEINSYRGIRHSKNLPSRGQRTKTNSRTVRGNIRKTAGSGKKPAAQKT